MSAPRWNVALHTEGPPHPTPSGSLLGRIRLPYPSLFTYRNDPVVNFEWRAWRWIINIGICLFICVVIPITVITQGYETVATYEVNFNATLPHWFNKLWFKPTAGSKCDPHIFTVGDTFVTNVGSFVWTVSATSSFQTTAKSGNLVASKTSTVGQYSSTSLDWCDVSVLHVLVDIVQFKTEVSAVITCYGEDYILANTVIRSGLEDDAWFRERTINLQIPRFWVQQPVEAASYDLLIEMRNLATITNTSQTIDQLAFNAFPTQCPQQWIKDPQGFLRTASEVLVSDHSWCTEEDLTAPPALGWQWSPVDVQVIPASATVPVYDIANAVNNTLQALVAAVRWDLGNLLPNNFISNTREVLTQNETFFHPFSMPTVNTGELFNYFTVNSWNTTNSFNDLPETPLLLVDFLCHLSTLKSASSLFVSVLIGTLSICTSAWTFLLLFCAWAYKESLKRQAERAKLPPQVQGDLPRSIPEGFAIPSEAKVGYTFDAATPGYEKTSDPISSYCGPEYQPMLPGSLHSDVAPNDG